jgi:cell division septation protein DedD
MNSRKTIYYLAFPAFIFLLCLFSYQLGFKRGVSHLKKEQISKVLEELEKTEDQPGKLTYYQDLHDEKNPIVAQVNADAKSADDKKKAIEKTTTVTVIKPTNDSEPTVIVNEDMMTAIQVGAFTDLGKADELTDKLKNAGFEAFTKPVQSKGSELFRVLVRSSKNEVEGVQMKLSTQGYKDTFVVTM